MALWDKKAASYGGKPYTIHWDDGTETIQPNLDICHDPKCSCCSSEISGPEYTQYSGLCRSCFAVNAFNIPGTFKKGEANFLWKRPVEVTFDWTPQHYRSSWNHHRGADREGNNFGIGDVVLHKPYEKSPVTRREGNVISLHEYTLANSFDQGDHLFLAKVFFGIDKVPLLPAHELETLTCNNLTFDTKEWDGKLDAVKINGRIPDSQKYVFAHPKARAIYCSYRMNHIVDSSDLQKIIEQALEIAHEIDQARLPRDRIHMWFMKRFKETGLEMEHAQVAVLLPYLMGEKESKYSLSQAA